MTTNREAAMKLWSNLLREGNQYDYFTGQDMITDFYTAARADGIREAAALLTEPELWSRCNSAPEVQVAILALLEKPNER